MISVVAALACGHVDWVTCDKARVIGAEPLPESLWCGHCGSWQPLIEFVDRHGELDPSATPPDPVLTTTIDAAADTESDIALPHRGPSRPGDVVSFGTFRQTARDASSRSWRQADVPNPWWFGCAAFSATAAALLAVRYADSPTLAAWCWLAVTGLALTIIDLRERRLPHVLTFAMAAGGVLLLGTAAAVEGNWPRLWFAVSAGVAAFAVAAVVQLLFPTHTGGGDTALFGALAVYLGWFGWSGLLRGLTLALGATAVVAVAVWLRRGRSATFPAGPSLIAGTLAAVVITP